MLFKKNRTSFVSSREVKKDWLLIDATGQSLGRLASQIALVLRGKKKAYFTQHSDCGDNIVVINAAKLAVSEKKANAEKFFWHTGYPGGIKETTWSKTLKGAHPERLLLRAIERMMPKDSPLARKQMKSLYVYAQAKHPHEGRKPKQVVLVS